MPNLNWTPAEKKISRQAFDAALKAELDETMATFKAKAQAASEPVDLWEIEEYLRNKRREIDEKYDYRYSQLIFVFSRLIHEGYLKEEQLAGLSEEKLSQIRGPLSFWD